MEKYIQQLQFLNIDFENLTRQEITNILETEFSFYRLLKSSIIFDKYKVGANKGKFVRLKFSDLYAMAKLDFEFSQLLMPICLQIEQSIKTMLIYYVNETYEIKNFFLEYYNNDKDHIDKFYTKDNLQILKWNNKFEDIKSMHLEDFLEIVQFGTLERMVHYFCKKSNNNNRLSEIETELYSVRRIRNIVAHGTSLISLIHLSNEYKNLKLLTLLGKNGIKNKTLTNNLSKFIVNDICNLLYVYFKIVNCASIEAFSDFDCNCCHKVLQLINSNTLLNSVYLFFKSSLRIFEKIKKTLDK
ncbi:MAG: Abi family protein [Clostridia bacterium]|nr:Abi family protein [Clostridia bacterium]